MLNFDILWHRFYRFRRALDNEGHLLLDHLICRKNKLFRHGS